MNYLKKILSLIIFIFISCSDNIPDEPIYPIPILKVKIGEQKSVDLSKYFKHENVDLLLTDNKNNISLNNNLLNINARSSRFGFEKIILLANGKPIQIFIKYEFMVGHTFVYQVEQVKNAIVMGSFNDWSRTSLPMEQDGNEFKKTIFLEPKKYEYKFVLDGKEEIDPNNPIYVSNNIGGWNSILDLSSKAQQFPGKLLKSSHNGKWLYFNYIPPIDGALPLEWIVLLNNTALHPDIVDPLSNHGIRVNIQSISNGLLRIIGRDTNGQLIEENQTIINNGKPLSTNSDDWHFAIIYNVMVDRFHDADPLNNKPIDDPNLSPLANFMGGDISGIKQKLDDGYFSSLGVNALWISPIQTQPDSSWVEWVLPNRTFSGYHGYWPIKPRQIDPRFGKESEFKDLIQTSHQLDTKIILDFVSNHVHQEHSYFKEHRNWFGNIELPNGEMNIRLWDGDTRLTTWFDQFIPSYDYPSSPEAIDQVVNDATWWIDTYDIDGLRQDAVKHVPHKFWQQLTKNIKRNFPNKHIYQIGETFGSDDLINSYINPSELDAQFNFSIYFNARTVFSSDNANFTDLGRVINENRISFGPIHLMGNITSSHDQLRFAGYADGQIKFSDDGIERSFEQPVSDIMYQSTYSKLANFYAFNISQPGIPIIYYGEEIGLMGEGDPGNRRMMRFEINQDERNLKDTFSKLNGLRKKYVSLSLGDQTIIETKGPIFATLKSYFDEHTLLIINQSNKQITTKITLPINGELLVAVDNNHKINIIDNSVILEIEPMSHQFYYVSQ